jgi:hypothetical protein
MYLIDERDRVIELGFRILEYEGTLEGLLPIMLSRLTLTYGV